MGLWNATGKRFSINLQNQKLWANYDFDPSNRNPITQNDTNDSHSFKIPQHPFQMLPSSLETSKTHETPPPSTSRGVNNDGISPIFSQNDTNAFFSLLQRFPPAFLLGIPSQPCFLTLGQLKVSLGKLIVLKSRVVSFCAVEWPLIKITENKY